MKTRPLISLVIGLILGLSVGLFGSGLANSPATRAVVPIQMRLDTGSFAKLAEAVKPAVVNVNVERKGGGARSRLEEFYGDEYFKKFFGDVPERLPRRGLGSGVIIDPAGVALTNAHVVDGADQVDVTMLDGTKHKAKVVGVDKKTDLAALRLESDGKLIWTYKEAMVPPEFPKSLLVVGSGAIGIEFASFYRSLDAEVTVVEMLPCILPAEDVEISNLARKAFARQGIAIHTGGNKFVVEDLYDPEINVRYGSFYLKRLLRRLPGPWKSAR